MSAAALVLLLLLTGDVALHAETPGAAAKPGVFGQVDFANSGAKAAQADFAVGMALLHDFEYPAAAEAFRRAQEADPGFAMAY